MKLIIILKKRLSTKKIKSYFCSRLLIDKGVNELYSINKKIKNKNIDFYLAGEIDEGNPNSITNESLNKIKS